MILIMRSFYCSDVISVYFLVNDIGEINLYLIEKNMRLIFKFKAQELMNTRLLSRRASNTDIQIY